MSTYRPFDATTRRIPAIAIRRSRQSLPTTNAEWRRRERTAGYVEKIYRVGHRREFLIIGLSFILIGILFTCVGALQIAKEFNSTTGSGEPVGGRWDVAVQALLAGFFPLAGGGVTGFLGWQHLGVLPYQLRLMSNGTLEPIQVMRRTSFPVSDISVIEKTITGLAIEDADRRQIEIHHARGSVVVRYFEEIEQFLAEVLARNPGIEVRGIW